MTEGMPRMVADAIRLVHARDGRRNEALKLGIVTSGATGERLDEIINLAHGVMLNKERENPATIGKMRLCMSDYLGSVNGEEVRAAYEKGLELTVKQHYRLGRKIETDLFATYAQISDAISAYTIDFYVSLRASERLGTSPSTALRLAQQTHNLGPLATSRLSRAYPELQRSTVEYFALGNPKDPESAIDKFLESKALLR